jgi:hypothetical protein
LREKKDSTAENDTHTDEAELEIITFEQKKVDPVNHDNVGLEVEDALCETHSPATIMQQWSKVGLYIWMSTCP